MNACRSFLFAVLFLLGSTCVYAADEGKIEELELREVCAAQEQDCKNGLETSPLFVTKQPVAWRECHRQHNDDLSVCVTLGNEDIERLNSIAMVPRRHLTTALVYRGKMITFAVLPEENPLWVGGSGGVMSAADVATLFRSSSGKLVH